MTFVTIYINDYSNFLYLARLLFLMHIANLLNITVWVFWRHCKFNMSKIELISILPHSPTTRKVCFSHRVPQLSKWHYQPPSSLYQNYPSYFPYPDSPHPVHHQKPPEIVQSLPISVLIAIIAAQEATIFSSGLEHWLSYWPHYLLSVSPVNSSLKWSQT
jgi:hypothetical protein